MARDHFRLCTCSQQAEVQPVGFSLIIRLGIHSNLHHFIIIGGLPSHVKAARQVIQARQGRAKSRDVQLQRQGLAMLQKGNGMHRQPGEP